MFTSYNKQMMKWVVMANIFEQYDKLLDVCNREKEEAHQNELYYMLCLSVVKNRKQIEKTALKLANKYGLLGALRLQRTPDKVQY